MPIIKHRAIKYHAGYQLFRNQTQYGRIQLVTQGVFNGKNPTRDRCAHIKLFQQTPDPQDQAFAQEIMRRVQQTNWIGETP